MEFLAAFDDDARNANGRRRRFGGDSAGNSVSAPFDGWRLGSVRPMERGGRRKPFSGRKTPLRRPRQYRRAPPSRPRSSDSQRVTFSGFRAKSRREWVDSSVRRYVYDAAVLLCSVYRMHEPKTSLLGSALAK